MNKVALAIDIQTDVPALVKIRMVLVDDREGYNGLDNDVIDTSERPAVRLVD